MTIYLLRHGRTKANANGLFQGRVDNPLDETGMLQARSAAAWIGPVDRVVSSPLLRARQTAEAFGVPMEIDERFIELDYGEWDERPVADVSTHEWRHWRNDLSFAPPGGESLLDVGARVAAALDDWEAQDANNTVVVVSHVSPIKAAAAFALHVDLAATWNMYLGQASVTRIGLHPQRRLLSFNESPPLIDQ